ncbi:MAG: MFS transporter [Candidatus Thorarchaeota archaeon]
MAEFEAPSETDVQRTDGSELQVSWIKVVVGTSFGVFLSALDASIVNVSLTTMKTSFGVGFEVQWIVIAYLLIFTSAMPLMGKFGDRYGKERVFKFGMIAFILGSFLCAISPTILILVYTRMFQAIGASMMTANGLALVTYFTTPQNRGRAIGMNSIVLAAALALGPVLGGVLSGLYGWPSIFLVNLPVGIIGFIAVVKLVPSTEKVREVKFDTAGAILFFAFLFLFVYSVSVYSSIPSSLLILILIWTVATFLAFITRESTFQSPIIPINVLSDRRISTSIFSALFSYLAIVPVTFLMPQYLQEALEFSPVLTGIFLVTHPAVISVTGPFAGFLSERMRARTQTVVGLLIQIVGLVIIGAALPNIIFMILGIIVMGFGLSVFSVANGNFIMTSAPRKYMGVVSALTNISRTTGFSVGTAAVVSAFSAFFLIFNPLGVTSGPEFTIAYTAAYQFAIWSFVVLVGMSVLISAMRGLSPIEGGPPPSVSDD